MNQVPNYPPPTTTDKVPTTQTGGSIVAKIFLMIYAFMMGFAIMRCILTMNVPIVSIFYGSIGFGSLVSVIYLSNSADKPEVLAGKQSRLGMLWLVAGALLKSVACYLVFAGYILLPSEYMFALIAYEIVVLVYVYFVFYADEENGSSWLVALKPSVLAAGNQIHPYPAAYPHGVQLPPGHPQASAYHHPPPAGHKV